MTKKMPSIRAVASLAGVSTATVSNVMNQRRSVAPELVARVRAAVAELGYITDLGAARLRSRRSTVAGVLVPDIGNVFFGAFVGVLEHAARRDGYDLLIASSGDDPAQEEAQLRALLTWRPAGVIAIPCENSLHGRSIASAAGVPLVAADRVPDETDMDSVVVDNAAITEEATRHLLQTGRRRIVAAVSQLTISNMRERCAGIEAAVAGSGAALEIIEAGLTLEQCRSKLLERLVAPPVPDALFTLNNIVTLGAIGALNAAGLAVPQDVALIGFDDSDWMDVVSPPLTAVRQPIEQMALTAWARLLARINGDTSEPQQIRLPCALALRQSSAQAQKSPESAVMGRRAKQGAMETP
jgi:LacI family transcriptional regulator